MPREVYDPKKPELQFYGNREIRPQPPKREISIFARKWFMFIYGGFLTIFVIGLFLYRNGYLNNLSFFKTFIQPIEIKVNSVEFYDIGAIITTIELKNNNYTNSKSIEKLQAILSLYKNKNLIYKGKNNFYNIRFPLGQRIGFKTEFDKNYWLEANILQVVLYFDTNFSITNNINISEMKKPTK